MSSDTAAGVRVVVQRAEAVEVLLDNDAHWARCGRCLVIFVSFAKGATAEALPKVVQTLLRIPVATLGQWATHTLTTKKRQGAGGSSGGGGGGATEAQALEQAPRSIISFCLLYTSPSPRDS